MSFGSRRVGGVKERSAEEHRYQWTRRRCRLVMIVEQELSAESRETLKSLLQEPEWRDYIVMVSGLTRASFFQASRLSDTVFYNSDAYMTPEKAFAYMPWPEVWLISKGMVWKMAMQAE